MADVTVPLLKFEDAPGFFYFSGNATLTSSETPPSGVLTDIPDICRSDKPMTFTFNWTQDGWVSGIVAGEWIMDVFFEKMGGGEYTGNDIQKTIAHVPAPGHAYSEVISVAAGDIPVGTYRLVARLKFMAEYPLGSGTCVNTPIVAFDEVGLVEFYAMP